MSRPTVIFQITAIGKNPGALEASARSVLYWVQRTPKLAFRFALWIIVEPEGYLGAPGVFDDLVRDGARLVVVPTGYETPLGTHGKARALQFACDERRRLGWSSANVWVYHQDEETCVGEDTLRGISEFVRDGRALVGTGVILYPIDWTGAPSHIQELTRSFDDFRVVDSLTQPGNPLTGFHGSHFLARADAEDAVGWDASGYSPAEDLQFEIRFRARFGASFALLRGFAYEKGAFSMIDQIKQRRRWMHGILGALQGTPELPRTRRAVLLYSALSWYSALPSVAILAASAVFRYGPVLLVTGLFTGFIWTSMLLGYVGGYRLHRAYLRQRPSWGSLLLNGVLGAAADIVAPWYALVTRPSRGDFISKDRPSAARPPRAIAATARPRDP